MANMTKEYVWSSRYMLLRIQSSDFAPQNVLDLIFKLAIKLCFNNLDLLMQSCHPWKKINPTQTNKEFPPFFLEPF